MKLGRNEDQRVEGRGSLKGERDRTIKGKEDQGKTISTPKKPMMKEEETSASLLKYHRHQKILQARILSKRRGNKEELGVRRHGKGSRRKKD